MTSTLYQQNFFITEPQCVHYIHNNSGHDNWNVYCKHDAHIHYFGVKHFEAETKWPPLSSRHFECIFLNKNVWISIEISLKFVPKGPINNIPALGLIMALRRPSDRPLSEPMVVRLPTNICTTRPQWVKGVNGFLQSSNIVFLGI